VKSGTDIHVLKGDPLDLGVTRQEIGMTWGCSPQGASTPSDRCYLVEVIGLNPSTGGFQRKISSSKAGTFVIDAADAPIRRWELADGAARAEPKRAIKELLRYREANDGKDARTGQPWVEQQPDPNAGPYDASGFDPNDMSDMNGDLRGMPVDSADDSADVPIGRVRPPYQDTRAPRALREPVVHR
jgi:hypothetical protein